MAVMEYKCPNCDGAINFDSATQQMKCPFCDSSFDVAALNDLNDAITSEKSEIEWNDHEDSAWGEGEQESMNVFSCNTCAGEIIADETTAATSCPFCGNPVILRGRLSGSARPDCIIPFKLNKKEAQEALAKHLSGKPLLPKCFKSSKRLNEIKGLYVPFWLFDAEVNASMRYKATTVRTWSDEKFIYTETKNFNVTRQGDLAFDSVPVGSSAKMPADLMESLEPFDTKAAVAFQPAFLSGYLADKFDFCETHSAERANQRIKKSTEAAFLKTVTGYASVTPKHTGVNLSNSTVRYALLPVWTLSATWRDESYMFAMNGQTGKFVGNLPTDWGIFWRRLIIIAIIIAAVLNVILLIAGVM
jgi:DNA-directed RNA polymerase subunit RPC12/RpoP